MQQCFDDLEDLKTDGDNNILEYFKSLPKPGKLFTINYITMITFDFKII
jgi:hypothetical protein